MRVVKRRYPKKIEEYPVAKSKVSLEGKPNQVHQSWLNGYKGVVLASKLVGGRLKLKVVHFGEKGAKDYTIHRDEELRKRYLKRSAGQRDGDGNLTKDDPFSANYWARKILW